MLRLMATAVVGLALALSVAGSGWSAPSPATPVPASAPSPQAPNRQKEAQAYAAFTTGQQLFKQGRWEESIKVLDPVVRENPHNAQAWYLLGLAHMQLKQWAEGERCLQQVVVSDARNYNAWVMLGDCAASQKQYERGRDFVRRIFTFDQRSFYAYYALGVIDYREGRLQSALSNFDRSRALYDEFAPTWYNLAVCAYNQQSPQIAAQRIRKAVVLEPKKPLYLFLMGWYAMMSNDPGSGHLAFRNLFEHDSKGSVYGDTARAFLALQTGNLAEARKCIDIARKKDPEMAKARVLDALLLVKEGKKGEAVAALKAVLEVDPLDLDARDGLVRLGETPPPLPR